MAVVAILTVCGAGHVQAQVMKTADLEKYAKGKYGEKWKIARHYPFVEKDPQKRTCAKALVMRPMPIRMPSWTRWKKL